MPAWSSKTKVQQKSRNSAVKDGVQGEPTTKMYILAATKATSTTLKSISSLIPVPGLGPILEFAIRIVETCEGVTSIEEDVEELRKRVVSLSILIVNKVTSHGAVSEELQARINNLHSILVEIESVLNAIKKQHRLLLAIFPQLNKDRIDKCVRDLGVALEAFDMSHRLQVEDILDNILQNTSDIREDVKEVKADVKKLVESLRPHTSPYTIGRQDMPPLPKIFFGRDSDVANIVNLLSSGDGSRICITASGGMGKTRLALAITHHSSICNIFGRYRFWVPCITATTADALRRLLYIQLAITAETFDSLDILIDELKATPDRRFILLDNFETPWQSNGEGDKISDILIRIADIPHITLLVTMTSAFPPMQDINWKHHHLHPLNALAAQKAFLAECPSSSSDLAGVDKLTSAVGYVPLAINLMARTTQGSFLPTGSLLKEWNSSGTGMLNGLDDRIQRSIDLVRANATRGESALKLLAILSMLPLGTTIKNLESVWATVISTLSSALSDLRRTALVECDDGESSRVYIIPTIQAYMKQHGLIPKDVQIHVRRACQEFVLAHRFHTCDEPDFKDRMAALSEEHNNIEVLLMQEVFEDDQESLRRAEALVAFCVYLREVKPSIKVAQMALDAAVTTKNRLCIAEAHEVLADMYDMASQFDRSYHYYEKAHQHFLDIQNFARAGECTYSMMFAWMLLDDSVAPELTLKSLVDRAQAELSHDKGNEYNMARGILVHGYYLWYIQEDDDARITLTNALNIFKRLKSPASSVTCLRVLSRTEARSGNYELALDLSCEALEIAEEHGLGAGFICSIFSLQSSYFIVLERYDEAKHALQMSLNLARTQGSFLDIAQVLDQLAYISTKQGDSYQAIQLYTEAQVHFGKVQSKANGEGPKLKCERNIQVLASGRLEDIEEPMLY